MFNDLFTWKDTILSASLVVLSLYFYFAYKKETHPDRAKRNLYAASFILSILASRLILFFYRSGDISYKNAFYILIFFLLIGFTFFALRPKQKLNTIEIVILLTSGLLIITGTVLSHISKTYVHLPAVFLILFSLFFFPRIFFSILSSKFISGYVIGIVALTFLVISATSIFRTALSLFHYARGLDYEKNNAFTSAVREYNSAFNYNPLLTLAKFRTARIYTISDNLTEASKEFNFLITQTLDTYPHFFLGQIYEKSKDNESAIKEYSLVNKKSKFFKNSKIRMAQLFIEQKAWNDALNCLKYIKDESSLGQLQFVKPQDSFDFANLVYVNNDPKTAVYFFIKAIKLHKDKEEVPPPFYYSLAKAYYDLKELSSARYYFLKVKEKEPRNLSTLYFLNVLENGHLKNKQTLQKEITIFEAEDLSHHSGKVVFGEDASAGKAWYANQKTDEKASFMVFGPGRLMPFGEYRAKFRLKTKKISDANLQICGMDVVGINDNNVFLYLASRPILTKDFIRDDIYQDFELDFHNPGNLFLQFRIQFINGEVWIDRITVFPDVD